MIRSLTESVWSSSWRSRVTTSLLTTGACSAASVARSSALASPRTAAMWASR